MGNFTSEGADEKRNHNHTLRLRISDQGRGLYLSLAGLVRGSTSPRDSDAEGRGNGTAKEHTLLTLNQDGFHVVGVPVNI